MMFLENVYFFFLDLYGLMIVLEKKYSILYICKMIQNDFVEKLNLGGLLRFDLENFVVVVLVVFIKILLSLFIFFNIKLVFFFF